MRRPELGWDQDGRRALALLASLTGFGLFGQMVEWSYGYFDGSIWQREPIQQGLVGAAGLEPATSSV
jgi:hypothetical protein